MKLSEPIRQEINQIWDTLDLNLRELTAIMLIGLDGQAISAKIPEEFDISNSILITTMFNAARTVSTDVLYKVPNRIVVSAMHGSLVVLPVGNIGVLFASVSAQAKLGLLFLELDRTVDQLLTVLKQDDIENPELELVDIYTQLSDNIDQLISDFEKGSKQKKM